MQDQDWGRLQALFAQARTLDADARARLLRDTARDEPELADALRRLLSADDGAGPSPTQAVGAAAGRLAGDMAGTRGGAHWVGRRIGAWRLVRHLADGGMGAVYLAERADGAYAQAAALKLLHPLAQVPDALRRFEVERQILARLNHPSIARLLDGGQSDDGLPYLVMEYVDGEPIDVHAERSALDVPARLRLVAEVCEAVAHAHRHLVVHRDLKPGNILVDRDGRPRLLDFGIAKLIEGADAASPHTRAEARLLTPGHASPEQLLGDPVTTATDVYALGLLLHLLLCGRLPFDPAGLPPMEAARRVLEDTPPLPSTLVTDPARRRAMRGDLDTVLQCATHRDPARRYATATALADDLRHHLAQRPLAARPDDWRYRCGRFLRRQRVPVAAAALLLASSAGFAAFHTWRLAAERDLARQAAAATEQANRFLEAVFGAADPEVRDGPAPSVVALVRAGVERVDAELQGQPRVQARMLTSLATVLTHRGRADEAVPLLDRALALRRAQLGAGHPDVAETLRALAEARLELAEVSAAAPLLDEALAIERARPRSDAAAQAQTLYLRAVAFGASGRPQDAVGDLDRALALLRNDGQARTLAYAQYLGERGRWRQDLGQFDAAIDDATASLDLKRALGADRHLSYGMEHLNLAASLMQQGRNDEAETHNLAALEHARRQGYADHDRIMAPLWSQLARLYVQSGRLDDADEAMQAALAHSRRLNPPTHPYYAYDLSNLARLRHAQGRLAEADRLLEQVRGIYAAHPDHNPAYGLAARLQQAWVRLDAGDATAAESMAREVLAAYEREPRLGPGGLDGHARSLLGAALAAQGRLADARPLLVEGLARLRAARDDAHHLTRAAQERVERWQAAAR